MGGTFVRRIESPVVVVTKISTPFGGRFIGPHAEFTRGDKGELDSQEIFRHSGRNKGRGSVVAGRLYANGGD